MCMGIRFPHFLLSRYQMRRDNDNLRHYVRVLLRG